MTLARSVIDRIEGSVLRRVGRLMDRLGWSVPSPEPVGPVESSAPVVPVVPVVPVAEAPPTPAVDQLTREQIEVLFEDMVRPALQSDGGDIVLVEVKNNDVFVSLTGACQTCPSSIMTMQMGIERLLREEFPHFGQLIRVD
jgi:Fe-S cluster biogenesis protein NfuA